MRWDNICLWVSHHVHGTEPCKRCRDTVSIERFPYTVRTTGLRLGNEVLPWSVNHWTPQINGAVHGLDCALGRKLLDQYTERASS